jgi:hypothetical protein
MGIKVEDNIITATWSFAAADAPASFAVTITEQGDERERPVATVGPIRIERRDAAGTVEWDARITLGAPVANRSLVIRATAGAPQTVGEVLRGAPDRNAPTHPVDELEDLRNLLDQQPDHGREMLSRIMPSADPDELRKAIDDEIDAAIDARDTRTVWPLTFIGKPSIDEQRLEAFAQAYELKPITKDQAGSQLFQTKEDWQRYATAKGGAWFHAGGEVERPLSEELANKSQEMTYDVRDGEMVDGAIEVAMFADNGNGMYSSRSICNQIVRSGLPYAFHLGDIYYGGKQDEIENFFNAPLSPMFDRTELFMITGNHEMYAGGEWFKKMIRRKASEHPHRQRQRAESFRLRGPGFQIIGLDTMFVGWKSGRVRLHDYADANLLRLLDGWLSERPNDLTILMSTNEAWDKGSKKTTPLYQSLRSTIAGRVDLWFWGNVHYAALFDMWPFADAGNPLRRMVTSCIGHGGYPFYTQKAVGALPDGLGCRWLETKSRFWPDTQRSDVGLNGWCKMKLARESDAWEVLLTYVDWAGRERLRARLARKDGGGIYFKGVEESEIASVGAPPTWRKVELGAYR